MPAIPSTLSTLASAQDSNLSVQLTVFNTLVLLALTLNAAYLAPALWSSSIHRRPQWYSLAISYIVYTISYLLIIGHQTGPDPPYGLCLAQAAFIYAAPPLCALSHTALVIDYYILASVTFGKKVERPWLSRTLLVFPWIVFVLVTYTVLLLIPGPSSVERSPNHFYCSIKTSAPFMVTGVLVFITVPVVLVIEGYTAMILYRHWSAFRQSSLMKPHLSLSMFLRLAAFTAVAFVVAGIDMTAIYVLNEATSAWAIVLTIVPILSALAFGTQADILRAWMFWRRDKSTSANYPTASDLKKLSGIEKEHPKPLRRMSIS